MVELQQKMDELEAQGVFKRPEEVGVSAEYLNPSFLVNKPNGGHRLVMAFADVGQYSKPQPSLLPDVDSTLCTIAKWKYIIVTDLTSAFYQIPLSRCSMKCCGVATPFRGVRMYTCCTMGMPGSETALEELMCRMLGNCVQDGIAATSTSLPQRPSSVLILPPSLVGNGQKEACQPALIILMLST